jgi:hypothetical protein
VVAVSGVLKTVAKWKTVVEVVRAWYAVPDGRIGAGIETDSRLPKPVLS